MGYQLITGDCLQVLPTLEAGSVQCCVTSPPYWSLRDYQVDGQLGLELTPEEYVAKLVAVFAEVWRVLKDNGTLWCNLGDAFSDKQLLGVPWRVAFALQAAGWYLRSDIIWNKPNPMPESVTDRPTKSHEYLFLLAKREKYYYDAEAIREPQSESTLHRFREGQAPRRVGPKNEGKPVGVCLANGDYETPNGILAAGRNRRSVWTIATQAYEHAHFATFPEKLVEPCILAGCPKGGTVLDPFAGSGTTGAVALRHQRNFIGIELNPEYVTLAEKRVGPVAQEVEREASFFGLHSEETGAQHDQDSLPSVD